jgi:hypothetical protein
MQQYAKLVLILAWGAWAGLTLAAAPGKTTVTFMIADEGGALLKSAKPGAKWTPVAMGQEIRSGDQIKTLAEARVEITLATGGVVRVGEKSLFTFDVVADAAGGQNQATLSAGKVWSNVKALSRTKADFKVQTPTAVAAIRGTVYNVEAGKDSSTNVKVYEGEVAVSNPPPPPSAEPKSFRPGEVSGPQQIAPPAEVSMAQWVEIIRAQQQIFIGRDGSKRVADIDMAKDSRDTWVKENQKRDTAMDAQMKDDAAAAPADTVVPDTNQENAPAK